MPLHGGSLLDINTLPHIDHRTAPLSRHRIGQCDFFLRRFARAGGPSVPRTRHQSDDAHARQRNVRRISRQQTTLPTCSRVPQARGKKQAAQGFLSRGRTPSRLLGENVTKRRHTHTTFACKLHHTRATNCASTYRILEKGTRLAKNRCIAPS